MKRGKCDENSPPTSSVPPKKKRGPYKQWAQLGTAMPRSTQRYRNNLNIGNTPKIQRIPISRTSKSLKSPSIRQGFVDSSISASDSNISHGKPTNQESEPPVQPVDHNVDSQPTTESEPPVSPVDHRAESMPSVSLDFEVNFCTNIDNDYQEPGEQLTETDHHDYPIDEEVEDPLFSIVEEFSDGEGECDDDIHSEESFILHYADDEEVEDSVEEIECEPDIDGPAFQLPRSPVQNPMLFDDSSDEELIDERVRNVNLSIEEKIKLLMVLAISKRHNLSYTAAVDVVQLSNVLGNENFTLSKHTMKSVIQAYSCSLTVHHMCPSCERYVGLVDTTSFKCNHCSKKFSTALNKKKQNTFLYLSLTEQLQALVTLYFDKIVTDPSKREKINEYNVEDIYDGSIYSRMSGGITISFFVDGLQVASTSKRSAWPILVCINELPLNIRRKSVLMASLWLSLKKPNCNEYMKPFVAECLKLEANGLNFKRNSVNISMQVKVIIGISDTIARPLLRNSTQFNGMYGCGFCLHPGIRMKYQKGFVRSYSTRDREFPRRTHNQLMDFARIAAHRGDGKPYRGIKGISILSQLPNFDMVACLDLDLFHALVNVAKRFANLWFLKKFSGKPFNIKPKFKEVNRRLLQITPTSDVSRAPRSMAERSDYRGHEWYHWVLEYSIPVLKNLLPVRYLNHWALLVQGIALIMQTSVARSEIIYAHRHLSSFVENIDLLYGKQHVTFSIHLLTHLKESVNNFGQPWAHSAFVFESFNAEIKRAVKSSNGVSYQICSAMQRKIALKKLEEEVQEYLSDQQKNYLNKMSTVQRLAEPTLDIGPSVSLMGKPSEEALPPECLSAVRRAGLQCNGKFVVYDRCQVNGEIYHSRKYSKTFRQNNSVCMLNNSNVFLIEYFFISNNQCYVLGNILLRSQTKLCDTELPHIIVLKDEPEGIKRCFSATKIDYKLLSFALESASGTLRAACINVLENEMLR